MTKPQQLCILDCRLAVLDTSLARRHPPGPADSLDSVPAKYTAFPSLPEPCFESGPMPHAKNVGCSILFTILACASFASAQQSPTGTQTVPEDPAPSSPGKLTSSLSEKRARIGAVDAPFPQSPFLPSASAMDSNGSCPEAQSEPCARAQTKPEWVFAPIPFSNQAFTWGLVPVAAYIFPMSKDGSSSPPSVLIAGGMVADGISWAIAGGGRLHLRNDRFRITAFGGHGTVAYDLFGTGTADGDTGRSVPIRQGGDLALGELLVRLFGKVFFGPRYNYRNLSADLNTREATATFPSGINPEDLGPDFTTLGPGFKLLQDSRNSTFYPARGNEFQFYGDFLSANRAASAALPEKQLDYQAYQLSENHYFSLAPKDVIAVRGMLCSVEGDAPFFELCQFGLRGDIRGYQPGRYRDRRMFAVQAEYRRILTRRWGFTAFVGMGEVATSWNSFTTGNLLPGGGIGGRFNLSKHDRINLRADVAYGRNGWSWNFALAEAF